jgi:putative DNA primase/helicase
MKTNPVNEFVGLVARKNTFNSWKDWVCSLPWDGIKRFDDFCQTVEVLPEFRELRDLYLKKWFLQLINITCFNDEEEGKVARMILVFQGKQYSGKTSWFKSLVPSIHNNFVTEGATLKISDSMTVLRCIQHVIVELGEINSTMRKSDIDELKNFLSSSEDILNMKYVTHPVTYRRRTVFFGSVNETEFLQDQTDNTRFICLPIISCNYKHNMDMQQIYAELLEIAKTDNNYFLSSEDLNIQKKMNSQFKSISVLEEKLNEIFEVENILVQPKSTMMIYNATRILEELGFNINNIVHKKGLTNEMAKILDSHGFKRSSKPKGWYMPNKRAINNIGF